MDFHPHEAPTAWLVAEGLLTPLIRLKQCGNVVTRAYSQRLRSGPPIEAKTSWGRFIFSPEARPFAPSGYAMSASDGMAEIHEVPPPPLGWLDLPDLERREALLGFLHEHLLTLGTSLHWELEPLHLAHESLLSDGIEYSLTTPAKSSPDRRHAAFAHMHCDGAGDYWLRLVVTDRAGQLVAQSPPLDAGGGLRSFNAAKKTLRWLDKGTVTVTAWPDAAWSKYSKPHVLRLGQGSVAHL